MNECSHGNLVGNVTLKDIYIIRNTVNNKVYIGQSKDAENRWKFHRTAAKTGHYKGESVLYRAMRDIGIEKFYLEILEKQIPDYNKREKYWIKYYNSIVPNGYNILPGGEQYPNFKGIDNSGSAVKDQKTLDSIIEDLKICNEYLTEIAKKYNVPLNTIHGINSGSTYYNEKLDYPIRKEKAKRKLSDNDIEEIIKLLLGRRYSIAEIAEQYNVSAVTINCINIGDTHTDICPDIKRPFRKGASPKSKSLTYEQVDEIINLILNTSKSYREIGRIYDVDHRVILNIKDGSRIFRRDNLTYPLRPEK